MDACDFQAGQENEKAGVYYVEMRKHRTILFGAAFLSLAVGFPAFSAHAALPSSGILKNTSNVRSTAGLTKIVATLPVGTTVHIIKEGSDWYEVALPNGADGWIASWLVNVAAPAAAAATSSTPTAPATQTAPSAASASQTGTLTNNSNVRKTAAVATGNIIEVLPLGTAVSITGTSGTWYSISYGSGKTGWVSRSLVAITNTGTAGAATAAPASTPTTSTASATTSSTKASAQTPTTPIVTASASVFPASVSESDISAYWQSEVNALRAQKGLRQLAVAPSLIGTAHTWATYLGVHGIITHTRPNGDTPEQWINTQGIAFTVQDSINGWVTNYFTENIAEKLHVQPNLAGVKLVLDQVAQMFLAEGPSGLHYQSIYKPDWNSVGVGWYPISNGDGTYTAYFVFHYGSLASA